MTLTHTLEGHHYSRSTGLEPGLASEGHIAHPQSIKRLGSFDLIVIGAGFAGLTAARDAATSGLSVLLIEGRDRIGGRTWTANRNGDLFEMGGTWIRWQQGYVWRELTRYGIEKDLKVTPTSEYPEKARYVAKLEGVEYDVDMAESEAILNRAFAAFCNFDQDGTAALPIPPSAFENVEGNPALIAKIDRMSVKERIDECLRLGTLDARDVAYLVPSMETNYGAKIEDCGVLDILRWVALSNVAPGDKMYTSLLESVLKYKIKKGTSHLARRMFEEANSTGNLSYSFSTAVTGISDLGNRVEVVVEGGRTFKAAKVITTIPLNVLKTIKFSPPLSPLRREALALGHVNVGLKVHLEVARPEFRAWSGGIKDTKNPSPLVTAFGDQILNSGNASLVSFGAANTYAEGPLAIPEKIPSWFGRFDSDLERHFVRAIFHEWGSDRFAQGTWAMASPGFNSRFQHELEQPSSKNVLWASADWAQGWKGFIDGAIEQGTIAAYRVVSDLRRAAGAEVKL
ncbi:hypothetical protein JCM10207_008572 [Rhodosporidiobolus poonsookiae]